MRRAGTETSSKTNHNVFEAFALLATAIGNDLGIDGPVAAGEERAVAPTRQGGSDDESFSEEDLMQDMNTNLAKAKSKKERKKADKAGKGGGVKAAKADVNVFRLDLTSLGSDAPVATADPVRCGGCGAMLNCLSRVAPATSEVSEREREREYVSVCLVV